MKLHPGAGIVALGVLLVTVAACSHHGRHPRIPGKPAYRSAQKIPAWVTRRPEMPGFFVTVGIATGVATLEEGQKAAVGAAVADIVTYLGIRAEVLYIETRTELTTRVTDQMTARGAARVASGQMVEMYYEERRDLQGGISRRIFDVYVLVAIPFAEIEKERDRIRKELEGQRALAAGLLQDGLDEREAGDFEGALLRWIHLLEIIQGDEESRMVARETEIEIARLVEDLEIEAEVGSDSLVPRNVRVHAQLRQAGRRLDLADFPLRLYFLQGRGRLEERARTDGKGIATVEIEALSPRNGPVVLAVATDMDRMLGPETDSLRLLGAGAVPFLQRLRNKQTEVVLVRGVRTGNTDGENSNPGRPTYSARREPERVVRGEQILIRMITGNDYVYAPDGRPENCLAFLLEITGAADSVLRGLPLNLSLVLDKSGSMKEEGKLDYLKQAAKLMVENLAPYDVFSLITYGSKVNIVNSAGTVSDPHLVDHMIEMIEASDTTNLSGGLLEGIRQAEVYHGEGMLSRVILVSDGKANVGITDPALLARYAARSAELGISVTTVGLGTDFDEVLLLALSNAGQGNYYYVDNPDEIPEILSREMNGLATILGQNVTAELRLAEGVKFVNSLGIPYQKTRDGVRFRMGQIAAGERIRLAFQLEVPPGRRGPAHFGTLSVQYDPAGRPGERVRQDFPVGGIFTEDLREAKASVNEYLNRYVHLLAIMDSMLLAKRSGSREAIQEVLDYLESELPKIQTWLEERDDQEMIDMVQMLRHCRMILTEDIRHSQGRRGIRDGDLSKEISYKLYRLRHHSLWEGDNP